MLCISFMLLVTTRLTTAVRTQTTTQPVTNLRWRERDAPWRIVPWDHRGPPAFLVKADFEIQQHGCGSGAPPTAVECVVSKNNSYGLAHFAHAAESVLACFSLFQLFPTLNDTRIVLTEYLHYGFQPWTRDLLKALRIQLYHDGPPTLKYAGIGAAPAGCSWRGGQRTRFGNGFLGSEFAWLGPRAGAALRRAVFRRGGAMRKPSSLRVGIVNRRGSRRLLNAPDLLRAIAAAHAQSGSRLELNASELTAGLGGPEADSFQAQAGWIRAMDVIIAPHGAGSVNYAFARTCTAILEVFPRGYYLPGFYLQLARAVGALPSAMYQGDYPYEETVRGASTYGGRLGARSSNMAPDAGRVAKWVVEAALARHECLNAKRGKHG